MRTIFYITLFLFTSNLVHAQDTLYRNDGSKQIAKILEVNETQIKYKPGSNLNGPTYVINRDDVIKIVYESGLVDVVSKKITNNIVPAGIEDPRNTDFGRNFISLNVPDVWLGSLTFNYERTFKSGDFSFKCPLSLGLSSIGLANSGSQNYDYGGYYNRDKIFSTGLDFYFYPFGQGKAKFFFGPSVEYGQFNYWIYNYNPAGTSNQKERGTYHAILLQNGFLFQPSKHFNLSINVGMGYSSTTSDGYSGSTGGRITFRGGLNMGYKF